jgi:hypothetical protein
MTAIFSQDDLALVFLRRLVAVLFLGLLAIKK